ncbi:unnamed protein product [Effrenium voratum]|nr:unnamed protein product [Effrenium voratum]
MSGSRGKTGLIHLKQGFSASGRVEFAVFAKESGRDRRIPKVEKAFIQAP